MARIESKALKELLHRVLNTRREEIGCETCFDSLDRFVELELEGKDAAQVMPLIQHHLQRCTGCHDEYTALLKALTDLQKN